MREHKSISIADQIFEQLERDILSGRYQKGEVLSELSLAKQLGVSRTPVREAIRRLEQEKILEESSRGLTVVGISHEDMLDMYEIRLQIEGLSARRAAERISNEELAAMRETLELQRFYVEKDGENNSAQIKNLDSQFHEQLYKASGSKAYCDTLISLHKKITKFRMASVSKHSRAMQSLAEHEAIYEALAARDAEKAAEAATMHTLHARDRIAPMEI
ncbi:MAG: GntR family transcriptional regulator [Eubacteriales bacterium]|nr:GntR family transcriptional regulator [Eubacteriales bacterium]